MQKFVYIFVALIVGVAAAFGISKLREEKVLQVNQIGYSHDKYSGTITVAGIMVGTSEFDRTVFGIMDVEELKCNTPECEKLFIPVMYNGKHPAVGDEVKLKGSFQKNKGGIVFKADTATVLRHHEVKITPQPARKWS